MSACLFMLSCREFGLVSIEELETLVKSWEENNKLFLADSKLQDNVFERDRYFGFEKNIERAVCYIEGYKRKSE